MKVYILRTQGTGKIPDYLQIRNADYVLLTHSRADKPQAAIASAGLSDKAEALLELIEKLPYGTVTEIDL